MCCLNVVVLPLYLTLVSARFGFWFKLHFKQFACLGLGFWHRNVLVGNKLQGAIW